MIVEFHNGPMAGQSMELPEPLCWRVQFPVLVPLMFDVNQIPRMDFDTVSYDLVADQDGAYYVYKETA